MKYLFTHFLHHEHHVTQGQVSNRVQQVWILSFPSLRLVAIPKLYIYIYQNYQENSFFKFLKSFYLFNLIYFVGRERILHTQATRYYLITGLVVMKFQLSQLCLNDWYHFETVFAYIYPTSLQQEECDTRSIFNQCTTGLKSEFFFS